MRFLQKAAIRVDNKGVTCQGRLCRLLVIVLFGSMARPACAQSLADAARRAEEQQRTAPADTQAFTDRDLHGGEIAAGNREALSLVLTVPLLQQYASARTALLRAMVHSPDLTHQVLGAMGRAGRRGVDGLEHEYAMIPPVVDATRAVQMDVHSYTVTESAFMFAVGVLAGKLSAPDATTATVATNVAFLQRHQQDVERILKEATELEGQLARSFPDANHAR